MAEFIGLVANKTAETQTSEVVTGLGMHGPVQTNGANTVHYGNSILTAAQLDADANSADKTLYLGGSVATGVVLGRSGQTTTVRGNLVVQGTTTHHEEETVQVAQNYMYLNYLYTTNSAESGGIVVNVWPAADVMSIDTSNGIVNATRRIYLTADPSLIFTADDIIQVSGTTGAKNDGLFQVDTVETTYITVAAAPAQAFLQLGTALVDDATTPGSVVRVVLSVLQASDEAGSEGLWRYGSGDVATSWAWQYVNEVTLQDAYDNGRTIALPDGSSPVDISGDPLDFGLRVADRVSLCMGDDSDIQLMYDETQYLATMTTLDVSGTDDAQGLGALFTMGDSGPANAAVGKSGGPFGVLTGIGGDASATQSAGAGGAFMVTCGDGGDGTAENVSGNGGTITITGGSPGADGGAGEGDGGAISLQGGPTAATGSGGSITLSGGGSVGGAGGDVFIEGGSGVTHGSVYIADNASTTNVIVGDSTDDANCPITTIFLRDGETTAFQITEPTTPRAYVIVDTDDAQLQLPEQTLVGSGGTTTKYLVLNPNSGQPTAGTAGALIYRSDTEKLYYYDSDSWNEVSSGASTSGINNNYQVGDNTVLLNGTDGPIIFSNDGAADALRFNNDIEVRYGTAAGRYWTMERLSGVAALGIVGYGAAVDQNADYFSVACGTGGASSTTNAGAGGHIILAAGTGGLASASGQAGQGGEVTITGGTGGAGSGGVAAAVGGLISIIAGTGGAGNGETGGGAASGGSLTIRAGQGGSNGAAYDGGSGGNLTIAAGATGTTGSTGIGGTLTLVGGNSTTANGYSGAVVIQSGNQYGTSSGYSGNVDIQTGTCARNGGYTGNINIVTGVMTGTGGSSGEVFISTGVGTGTELSGNITIQTGVCASTSGYIILQSGPSETLSGDVMVQSGYRNNNGGTSGNVYLRSGDDNSSGYTGTSGTVTVASGNSNTNVSGAVSLYSGNVTTTGAHATGAVTLSTGNHTNAGALSQTGNIILCTGSNAGTGAAATSGSVSIYSGATTGGNTGAVSVYSGAAPSGLTSGAISIYSGGGTAGTSGAVTLASGTSTSAGTGIVTIASGVTTGGTTATGEVRITSGAPASGGASGTVYLRSGETTSAASGHASVYSGPATSAASGNVAIYSGNTSTSGNSGSAQLYSGNSAAVSGAVSIYSGTGTGTGNLALTTGNASSGDSGYVSLTTGTATGTRGNIRMSATHLDLQNLADATAQIKLTSTVTVTWSSSDPSGTPGVGSLWIDTTDGLLSIYTGSGWMLVGAQNS